jgi:serine/threonine protein kinase
MSALDSALWARLSPLLDECLDLASADRAAWLDALHLREPDLAEALAPLLARHQALEDSDFLASPALEAPAGLRPGQRFGAYTLERELGRGGMGQVWLARRDDGQYDGQVAIKRLADGLLAGSGAAARFAREGRILARLAHPHIARLLDAGLGGEPPQPYLVLEYVDGVPITQHCAAGALSVEQRVRLFLQVLAAVTHAHQRLILHRDLKPGNILVERASGAVKLLDFGIAKLLEDPTEGQPAATELTRLAGRAFTLRYAAPEQVQGLEVTTATDVYALGLLLHQLLCGQAPDAGPTAHSALEAMRAVVERRLPRPSDAARHSAEPVLAQQARSLRGDLDTIVAKALQPEPSARYEHAEALAEDLRRWLAHLPINARPEGRLYTWGRFVRRHRLGVAATAAVLLSLSGGAGMALWKAREAQAQRAQAEGLIEFMLGDLRRQLDPFGRLDVLDPVAERALAYYAAQSLDGSDADSLGRRARALHLVGELAVKRGRLDEAALRFQAAAESTAEQLARDPARPQRLFDHAQSEYWVGYAAWQRQHWPEAEAAFKRYLDLAQRLLASAPGLASSHAEMAYAHHNLGVLAVGRGRAAEARRQLQDARAQWQAVGRLDEGWRLDEAGTLGWLAEAEEADGQPARALSLQQEKQSLLDTLAQRQPQRADLPPLQAASEAAEARLQLDLGQIGPARAASLRALDTYQRLASHDPDNLQWQEHLGFAQLQAAETALVAGDASAARPALADARLVLQRLLARDPEQPVWALNLRTRILTAELQAGRGAARAVAAQALAEHLERLDRQDAAPEDERLRHLLALASLQLAAEHDHRQHPAAAAAATARARRWLSGQGGGPRLAMLQAWALWRQGDAPQAAQALDGLGTGTLRHPLYAGLRAALATSPGGPAHPLPYPWSAEEPPR